ncbi:type II secretion system F family protein [Chengkuizengella axinellae]|uniref:Type II secretion system F family protein n=1 Tax=Chengkuizengella axinellae TaxID=3064388 RepID=A0ABT9IY54_9BACL|nr:type II secretion system F family protein [Chengkuizengella sp. 2205SS18-9]MDP5274301.1 type II secretion system F family protein [Chengkuizengella sp. 2205SS18-9]
MPQYTYKCKDLQGKKHKGQINAPDKTTAMTELKKQKWIVYSLKEYNPTLWSTEIYFGNPVKNKHFIIFCRQLSALTRAGVSIVESIRVLAEQTESKPLKKALTSVSASMLKGNSFSHSASEYKQIFPPIFINMIRAGEESGNMEDTLDRLATYFEKAHYTKEKVKSAMMYPMIVGLISVIVIIYLMNFVVPRFVGVFEDLGTELPLITKLVISTSDSMQAQWYFWLIGIIVIVVGFQLFKRSKLGSYILDYVKLKMPVFGMLNQKSMIAQMSRTLSSLYASSVPVLQSLTIVERVVDNKVIGNVLNESKDSLRKGLPLSEPLKKSWVFPPLVTQMIAIGEETGTLDEMLGKVAEFYEKDVENLVDRLKSLLEPLLILMLTGVVGTIIAAILIPMLSIYSNLG